MKLQLDGYNNTTHTKLKHIQKMQCHCTIEHMMLSTFKINTSSLFTYFSKTYNSSRK